MNSPNNYISWSFEDVPKEPCWLRSKHTGRLSLVLAITDVGVEILGGKPNWEQLKNHFEYSINRFNWLPCIKSEK